MFAYDNLVQWFKDRCSDQVSRRNRAWNFGRGGVAVRVRGGHVVASWPWPSVLWM